jgi:hypothetical protein
MKLNMAGKIRKFLTTRTEKDHGHWKSNARSLYQGCKKNGPQPEAASRSFIRDGMTSNDYLFKR